MHLQEAGMGGHFCTALVAWSESGLEKIQLLLWYPLGNYYTPEV